MTRTLRQVTLNLGLRILLAVLGAVGVSAGVAVGAAAVQRAMRSSPALPAILLALSCAVIIAGSLRLLRGAWQGRIAVRDPSGGAFGQRREGHRDA